MFERQHQKIIPIHHFFGRMIISFGMAAAVVLITLGAGVLGYHYIASLSWLDALLNASMILTGMGPVASMNSSAAKLFASGYALFCGVVFLSALGIVLAHIFHRIMHRFHVDEDTKDRS